MRDIAIICPPQGFQNLISVEQMKLTRVGAAVLQTADRELKPTITQVWGDESLLTDMRLKTSYMQTGTFVATIAAMENLVALFEQVSGGINLHDYIGMTIGSSLGELSALHIAGRLTPFLEGLRLVDARGSIMQGSPEGAMTLVTGKVELERIREVCAEVNGELKRPLAVVVSNLNAPGMTMVSGFQDAVEMFEEKMKKEKSVRVKRESRLPYMFHSPIGMYRSAEQFRSFAEGQSFSDSDIRVVSNWQLREHTAVTSASILVEQMRSEVNWVGCIREAASSMDLGICIGPGAAEMAKMVRRTVKEWPCVAFTGKEDVKEIWEAFKKFT